jgi:hypothetical protein
MRIGIIINCTVQPDAFLNSRGVIKLFPAFYIIADHIAHQYFGMIKGKVCMGQVIHNYIKVLRLNCLRVCGRAAAINKKLMPFSLFNSMQSSFIFFLRKNYKHMTAQSSIKPVTLFSADMFTACT